MISPGPGVWVTGPSRSGTSMVAGLFAAHGVFFGDCIAPNRYNPKGFFESAYLKRVLKDPDGPPDDWPAAWFLNLVNEGLANGQPWGVKCGPERADLILRLRPAVVVLCLRPLAQIARSRGRVHWANGDADGIVRSAWARMDAIRRRPDVSFAVAVRTHGLVAGDATSRAAVGEALGALGLPFSAAVADDWIDPKLWNR